MVKVPVFSRRAPVMGFLARAEGSRRPCPEDSRWCERQIAHSDQVVDRQGKAEDPIDQCAPAMAGLNQPADRLKPAEDLFYQFALALTQRVAPMPGSTLVDNSGLLEREMRSDLMLAQFLNQLFAVVTFVSAQRHPMPARNPLHHRHRRLRFGPPASLGYAAVDHQPVAILHQHMAGVAELGFLAGTLARQPGLGVGRRLVGIVAALLAVKVDARIAGVVGRDLRVRLIFALKALLSGPRFNQGAVDREGSPAMATRGEGELRGLD